MDLVALVDDHNPWWQDPLKRRATDYPVRRDLQPPILERLGELESRRAVVVRGPRQVGKTVLLLQTADDLLERGWPAANITYFDFSDDRVTGLLTAREIADVVPHGLSADHPRVFLFDEVSRARSWDRWLKQAVDRRVGRVLATDSSASLLRQGGVDSGQGRWDEITMEGLSFREYLRLNGAAGEVEEETFTRAPGLLERYLAVGGFPEHARHDNPSEIWRLLRSDIVDRAIARDVAGRVQDPYPVGDLFVHLVQSSGAQFNAAARASDLGADARSVRNWLEILVDTCLVAPLRRLPSSSKASARLKSRSRQKCYAADHGLVSAFAVSPDRVDDELRGRIFEAVVFSHLRNLSRHSGSQLFYFRERDRHEIDFILQSSNRRTAIEVTGSSRIRHDRLRRLAEALPRAGADRALLIHGGRIDSSAGDTGRIPLAEFLLNPARALESASR